MLSSISWQQFLRFIVMALSIYYVLVWILIFKFTLPSLKSFRAFLPATSAARETARHIMEELEPLFVPGLTKKDLLFSLQQHLKKYNSYDEPGFRRYINRFINRESGKKCSCRLSVEDQRVLWITPDEQPGT